MTEVEVFLHHLFTIAVKVRSYPARLVLGTTTKLDFSTQQM